MESHEMAWGNFLRVFLSNVLKPQKCEITVVAFLGMYQEGMHRNLHQFGFLQEHFRSDGQAGVSC